VSFLEKLPGETGKKAGNHFPGTSRAAAAERENIPAKAGEFNTLRRSNAVQVSPIENNR
jgi:hypothetical protein